MALADDLVEAGRAHPHGQRRGRMRSAGRRLVAGHVEETVGHEVRLTTRWAPSEEGAGPGCRLGDCLFLVLYLGAYTGIEMRAKCRVLTSLLRQS